MNPGACLLSVADHLGRSEHSTFQTVQHVRDLHCWVWGHHQVKAESRRAVLGDAVSHLVKDVDSEAPSVTLSLHR
jgi:hypothetical protein